jgi:hypothetical protein
LEKEIDAELDRMAEEGRARRRPGRDDTADVAGPCWRKSLPRVLGRERKVFMKFQIGNTIGKNGRTKGSRNRLSLKVLEEVLGHALSESPAAI